MTTAIVLAAGGASRFGGPKQIAELEGMPLVRRVVETVIAAKLAPIVCVVGAYKDEVSEALTGLAMNFRFNPEWASGLSSSIRVGVEAAVELGEDDSAAIVLGDQPFVGVEHLRALDHERAVAEAQAAATAYTSGHLGPPAVFAASVFNELKTLAGDRGAKELLARLESVVRLEAKPGELVDIDRPTDMA